jgi:uncharacterized metal-binding protein
MSGYDTHESLGLLPLPLVLILFGMAYEGDLAEMLPYVGFLAWWVIHTLVITPDVDTDSIPSRRLGPIGWIIRTFSEHRKTWHSPIFWVVYFALQYYFIGWWTLGGVYPVFCHLYTDKITSWLNRRKIVKLIKKLIKQLKKLF